MNALPGAHYDGPNPQGFVPGQEMIHKLEEYAARLNAVQTGVTVHLIEPNSRGFRIQIQTEGDKLRWVTASNVVIASGFFGFPNYRNAGRLPAGPILVVGSGQSGCQITEDLLREGREVYLSTSKVARVPRRYRGGDIFEWWSKMGVFDETVADLEDPDLRYAAQFLICGDMNRGRTLSLQMLARRGVHLVGQLADFQDDHFCFRDNVLDNIQYGDRTSERVKRAVDQYIERAVRPRPQSEPDPADESDPVLESQQFPTRLNPEEAGTRAIIWCTGYGRDFSWIRAPLFNDRGQLMQERGQSVVPGLYFVGFPWLHRRKSGLIYGVEEDARYVAQSIVAKLFPTRRLPPWVILEAPRHSGPRPPLRRSLHNSPSLDSR
jgi:putative flavoprotein involved in K+ transport